MLRAAVLVFLAFVVTATSAVFVGKPHYGKPATHQNLHLMLGANKCTWGPGYWCQNISTSHECGSRQHCMTKAWNTLELPKDETEPCKLCVTYLSDLEHTLKANLTKDVLKGYIDMICSNAFIPLKVCEKYLDPFTEDILDAIANHIKPQVTCSLIHFCNNEEGVGKTYERLALVQSSGASSEPEVASALGAFKPLGPVLTGGSPAVYGGASPSTPLVAPLSCHDGQVYWCKSLENAEECNRVEHCKKVVWAHQAKSPLPDISNPQADSTATPPTSVSPINTVRLPANSPLCNKGQSFWCANLANAASCQATAHCIQSVWTHLRVSQDDDGVCKICKDMVKQARDQLTSNETQTDLKNVFEGSCNLIPVKVVREGCDKLADDFVPELVEVLSSQMNPDVVCSVAGLCNNAAVDKLMASSAAGAVSTAPKVSVDPFADCKNCESFAHILTDKFAQASKQQVQSVFRSLCSELSSLSDACLKVVATQGDLWYAHLKMYFESGLVLSRHNPFSVMNMCYVNNMCTNTSIPTTPALSVEVSHKSETGVLSREAAASGDDLPCSLCDQLVLHLKDIMVANTTETEFKQVLEGICKQTGAFSAECTDLVEQYYAMVYEFLTTELKPDAICVEVGLCPKPKTVVFNNVDILAEIPIVSMPLEPVHQHAAAHSTEDLETSEQIHMQDASVQASPPHMIESSTKPVCVMCEYILHFVQEQVADTKNEQKIIAAMNDACKQMPGTFAEECEQFVQEYGNAFIALVIQQIDPSQVCPKLKVCSRAATAPMNFYETESSKGACPLCLLAVQALDENILNNRTEATIKHALDNICAQLPRRLSPDCDRFVEQYYEELVDALVAETNPQEICVYIHMCLAPKPHGAASVQPAVSDPADSQACILCEFVMTKLDKLLKDRKTEEEIKHAVHSVCRLMPRTVRDECNTFVDTYSDLIIQLLAQSLSPKEMCDALNVCKPTRRTPDAKVTQCAVCEEAMAHLDDALVDPKVNNNIKTALDKVCYHVSKSEFDECNKFILKFGTKILTIIESTPSYLICKEIKVCPATEGRLVIPSDGAAPKTPRLPSHVYGTDESETHDDSVHHPNHSAATLEASADPKITESASIIEKPEECTKLWGYVMCEHQVPLIFIGMLMIGSLIVIFVVARSVRRNRRNTQGLLASHPPYEKLYQPTTIPAYQTDDFTSTIVR